MNLSSKSFLGKPNIISTPVDDILSKEIDEKINKLDIMGSDDNGYSQITDILKSMYTYVNGLDKRELYIPPKPYQIINNLDFGVNGIGLGVTTLIPLWDIWGQIKIYSPKDSEKFNDKAGKLFKKFTETFGIIATVSTLFSAIHNNQGKAYCFMIDMILGHILPDGSLGNANILEDEYTKAMASGADCAKDRKTFVNRYIKNGEETLVRFIRFSKFIDHTLKEFTKENRESDFKNISKIVDFIYYSNLFKETNPNKNEILSKLGTTIYETGHLKAKLNKLNLDSVTKFKFLKKFLGQNGLQGISLYINKNKTGC